MKTFVLRPQRPRPVSTDTAAAAADAMAARADVAPSLGPRDGGGWGRMVSNV